MDWVLWGNTMFPLTYSAGPGNVLVAVSGVRVGIWRTLPFILGLDLTYFILSIIVGLGLGSVLASYPLLTDILKCLGIAYILYLGSRFFILSSKAQGDGEVRFQFFDGIVVQL